MQTNLEKIKRLLDDFDVGYELIEDDDYYNNLYGTKIIMLRMESKVNKNVDGYYNFVCSFIFDENGRFLKISIYE